jgi:phage protein D
MTRFINTLPAPSVLRQPRGIVKVNDVVVPGWIEFEVDNNAFYQADTFRCKFAISALPVDYAPAWWASQSSIFIELFIGFPEDVDNYSASDLDSFIYGQVDELIFDPVGTFIEVSGRDKTADFVDAKTYEQFVNNTASEIAEKLAARHGLTPVVTATTTKAGTYYQLENRRIPLDRSEWDLLTWLAQEEGFSVYVKGKELHFEPRIEPDADQYALRWVPAPLDGATGAPQLNAIDVVMSRNLTLAKDIVVFVRSWNVKQKKGFTVKAQASHTKKAIGKGAAEPDGAAQTYSFVKPGLTKEQAQDMANKKLAELSSHEMKISANQPGDNLLSLTTLVNLSGTGTAFDQTYYPDSVVRRLSTSTGYTMRMSAKNHSPESTVLA